MFLSTKICMAVFTCLVSFLLIYNVATEFCNVGDKTCTPSWFSTKSSGQYVEGLVEETLLKEMLDKSKHESSTEQVFQLLDLSDKIDSLQADINKEIFDESLLPESKFDIFVEWARSNDFLAPGFQLLQTTGKGNGLFAERNFEAGEIISNLSEKSVFSTKTALKRLNCLNLTGLIETNGSSGHWSTAPLALYLLAEQAMGNDSAWKPYIDILPRSQPHLYYFDRETLMLMKESIFYEDVLPVLATLFHMYAHLHSALASNESCANECGLDVERFTLKAFRWAMTIVLSRAYNGDFGNNENDNKVMIPYWDLFNHDPSHHQVNVRNEPTDNSTTGHYVSSIQNPIHKGEEVFFCYIRDMDPWSAFFAWGIVQVEKTWFKLQIYETDGNYQEKLNVLNAHGLDPATFWFEVQRPSTLSGQRVRIAREMAQLVDIANGMFNKEWTAESVTKTWIFVSEQIDRFLKAFYPRSVDKVEASLHELPRNGNKRIVLQQVAQEQRLLLELRNYCFSLTKFDD